MKKKLLIIVSILFLFSSLYGEEKSKEKISFGAKIGLNLNKMSYSPGLPSGWSSNYDISYHLGLAFKIPFTKLFSIQPEILFNTFSTDIKQDSSNMSIYRGINIDIPLLLRLDVIKSKKLGLNIHAGPSLGFNIKSEVKNTVGGVTGDWQDNTDTEVMNFSLYFGIGLSFDFYQIELRYNLGLSDIDKGSNKVKLHGFYAAFSVWI